VQVLQPAVQTAAAVSQSPPAQAGAYPQPASPAQRAPSVPPSATPYARPVGEGSTTHPYYDSQQVVPSAPQAAPGSMPQPVASHVAPVQPYSSAQLATAAAALHQAVRVAVALPDASGELRVRPLGPNEPAPAGTHAAHLVALDPGAKLVG